MTTETVPGADRITAVFEDFCHHHDLSVVATNIDRHGSIEWSAVQRGPLNRYLSLSFTPRPSGPKKAGATDREPYRMEIWYSVDDMRRYLRKRAGTWGETSSSSDTTVWPPDFYGYLEVAWKAARSVREADLTGAMLFPVYGDDRNEDALQAAFAAPAAATPKPEAAQSIARAKVINVQNMSNKAAKGKPRSDDLPTRSRTRSRR